MANYIWALYGILTIVSFWLIFNKANEKGWKAVIPFYNIFIALKIVNRPWWWLILFLIPGVNIFMLLILFVQLIKSFGKYDFKTLTIGMLLAPAYLLLCRK